MDNSDFFGLLEKARSGNITKTELAGALFEEVEKSEKLLAKIEEDRPKVEFYEKLTGSKEAWYSFGKAAKLINYVDDKNKIIGRNDLYRFMRDCGAFYKDGDNHNIPAQRYVDNGYFRIDFPEKLNRFNIPVPKTSAKGIEFIIKILDSLGFKQYTPKAKKSKLPLQIQQNLFEDQHEKNGYRNAE